MSEMAINETIFIIVAAVVVMILLGIAYKIVVPPKPHNNETIITIRNLGDASTTLTNSCNSCISQQEIKDCNVIRFNIITDNETKVNKMINDQLSDIFDSPHDSNGIEKKGNFMLENHRDYLLSYNGTECVLSELS